MKVGLWSTTPANNNNTPPDGWPEGQAPSTVNDCAREMMASIRTLVANPDFIDLGNTPSYVNSTQFSLATADVANFEVGRRLKLFDTTILYGTIISVSAANVQVRLDSGILSTSLSSVAVGVLHATNNALPDNVYHHKNIIINGQMQMWQRGASFSATNTSTYLCDRFTLEKNSNAGVGCNRLERSAAALNVPTLAQAGTYLNNSLNLLITTSDPILSTSAFCMLSYRVEGYDWAQIAHKPLGVSFWCLTNCSGIYTCALRSGNGGYSYLTPFTVSSVLSWTRFHLAIPEAPTSGTWDYSTGKGIVVSWTFGSGTQWQATANEWTAMNALAVSSQVNFLGTSGNAFLIADVRMHEGRADVPVEIRDINTEMRDCLRYYWRGLPAEALNFPAYTAGCVASWTHAFTTPMRIAPTLTSVLPTITYGNANSLTASLANNYGFRITAFSTIEHPNCTVNFTSPTDYIEANAEL